MRESVQWSAIQSSITSCEKKDRASDSVCMRTGLVPRVNHPHAVSCPEPEVTAVVSSLPHPDSGRGVSQRSAIKQRLEDAFRENGFLVKTKQVSDGEATFCKFRQLRKYTRYYLKSWHKHLPDEVNKLYKGFLPPVPDKCKK